MLQRHCHQRGQALPLVAIFGTLLLGAAALAVDLSLQTHQRRTLQNVTDTAALTAAADLTTNPVSQSQRTQAVVDGFLKLHNDLQFPTGGTTPSQYVTGMVTTGSCPGASCTVGCPPSGSTCAAELVAGSYDMFVSSPPLHAAYAADATDLHAEVMVTRTTSNQLGAFVGQLQGRPGAHSIAFHRPPNQHSPFALFAQSYVQDGNAGEVISGNVYATQYLAPQSSGQSYICMQGGGLVLGTPQAPHAPPGYQDQSTNPPVKPTAQQVTFLNGVSGVGSATCQANPPPGGTVAQTVGEGCSAVPGFTPPPGSYTDDFAITPGSGTTLACVAPQMAPPTAVAPSLPAQTSANTYSCGYGTGNGLDPSTGRYQPGYYCQLTVDHPLAPGMYVIFHSSSTKGADLDLTQSLPASCTAAEAAKGFTTCLDGVTFDLAVNPSHPTAPTVTAETGGQSIIEQTPYCPTPRLSGGDCVFTIYAAQGVTTTVTTTQPFTTWFMTGTLWAPSGVVTMGQNTRIQIDGQAVVNQWNDQSGYHPNPVITYDANAAAPLPEVLRLVE